MRNLVLSLANRSCRCLSKPRVLRESKGLVIVTLNVIS